MVKNLILGSSLMLGAALAQAASFDCDKAVTDIEKKICSDSQLSEVDSQLASLYKKSLLGSKNADALKAEQRSWLRNTRNKCQDNACIKQAYIDRIASLDSSKTLLASEQPLKEQPLKEQPLKEQPLKEQPLKEQPLKEERSQQVFISQSSSVDNRIHTDSDLFDVCSKGSLYAMTYANGLRTGDFGYLYENMNRDINEYPVKIREFARAMWKGMFKIVDLKTIPEIYSPTNGRAGATKIAAICINEIRKKGLFSKQYN